MRLPVLHVGDHVRLKPVEVSESVGIDRRLSGGEAVIVGISEDNKGTVFTIKLKRNGKTRSARRKSIAKHVKLSVAEQAKLKKRAAHVASEKDKKKRR